MLQRVIISLKSVHVKVMLKNVTYLEGECICELNVIVVEKETSKGVFNNVLDISKRGNINKPENHIDPVHRIGKPCMDNTIKKHCKSIIVTFTYFLTRALV